MNTTTPPPTPPVERRARPRFDTMSIWDEAIAALLANREVLLAVLGVFSILPNFALQMLAPFPEPVSGQSPEQLLTRIGLYFDSSWLPFMAAILLQFFGMLVTLALLGDRSRPTVSEAIRHAARSGPSFLAALMLGLALSFLVGLIPVVLIGLTGSLALTKVGAVIGTVIIFYMLVRFAFTGPAVLLGGYRNPMFALRISFSATKGIGWQLLVFILLIFIAFNIVGWLITAAVVILTGLVAGTASGAVIGSLIACFVQAALDACFVAVIAVSYRHIIPINSNMT